MAINNTPRRKPRFDPFEGPGETHTTEEVGEQLLIELASKATSTPRSSKPPPAPKPPRRRRPAQDWWSNF